MQVIYKWRVAVENVRKSVMFPSSRLQVKPKPLKPIALFKSKFWRKLKRTKAQDGTIRTHTAVSRAESPSASVSHRDK